MRAPRLATWVIAVAFFAAGGARAERLAFAVMGDTPYFPFEAVAVERLLDQLGNEPLAFVIHVGDIKASFYSCTDELLRERVALLDRSPLPLVYTPGDNEWTDCGTARGGGFDPNERLDFLRELAFRAPVSLGRRRIGLETQGREAQGRDPAFARYRENVRWRAGPALFVTINIPGSNNGLGRGIPADRELAERMKANISWLDEAVRIASDPAIAVLAIAFQGNPLFAPTERRSPDGYGTLRAALARIARNLAKPIVVIHGDTHTYRVDRPLIDSSRGEPFPNVMRIETFGAPTVGAAIVTIDTNAAPPVRVQPFRPPEPGGP